MPKQSNPKKGKRKRPHKKVARRPKGKRHKAAAAPHPQHQFHSVHNSALKNYTRDTEHAEKIRNRIKEDTTLSEHKLEDMMKHRSELIKH